MLISIYKRRFSWTFHKLVLNKFCYDEMPRTSNQPACFFIATKTHNFEDFEKTNFVDLKLRPTTVQTGTCIYSPSKVLQSTRSICLQVFYETGALKKIANFTGKYLCWSLFLIKLLAFRPETTTQFFPVKFAYILRTAFLHNTSDGWFWSNLSP